MALSCHWHPSSVPAGMNYRDGPMKLLKIDLVHGCVRKDGFPGQ
jgi:hypothetical protein